MGNGIAASAHGTYCQTTTVTTLLCDFVEMVHVISLSIDSTGTFPIPPPPPSPPHQQNSSLLTNTSYFWIYTGRLPNGETTKRWSLDDYDLLIYGIGTEIVEGFSSHNPKTRKALRDACRHGLLDRVVACIETHKVPMNHNTTIIGNTPLILAVLNGHLHVVKYLVESRANVNLGNRVGVSPLFIACIFGKTEVVAYLG